MADAIHVELADRLRSALRAKSMTQRALAHATGCSEKHISQILNGKAEATTGTWALLLDAVMPDHDAELAHRAREWCETHDGGRLCVRWPAGSKPDDDSRPIMAIHLDHGGTNELGTFYYRKDANAMQLICDVFNDALERLVPSGRGFYGSRTYVDE